MSIIIAEASFVVQTKESDDAIYTPCQEVACEVATMLEEEVNTSTMEQQQ